ncbi:MAG: hypothetical protein U9Q82_01205 [Chloroflexota bacterium]|nr:hypothetical protein [Chloroflexota bacterium]
MTALEWLSEVSAAAEQFFPNHRISIQVIRETRVKVRIEINQDAFLDLFFREETKRTDYTLIMAGQRRYGVDNLVEWHVHPIAATDTHIPTDEPTPEDALRLLREAVDTLIP